MKSAPPSGLDENGEPLLNRDELEADLCRRIEEWARLWEKCPLAGCRRNARCLHDDDCRIPPAEPWTDEDRAWFRALLDVEIERRRALGEWDPPSPPYDGRGR